MDKGYALLKKKKSQQFVLNITAPAMLTCVNIYFEQVLFLSILLLTLGHIFRAYIIQTSLKSTPEFYTS